MKKLLIYLSIIVVLFGALYVVNDLSNKKTMEQYKDNPYKMAPEKLHPETVKQLKDPNYQNIILPDELEKKINNKENFFIYYFSSTCPHCKVTTPVLWPISKEVGVDMKQLNLQEFPQLWQKYKIDATPTLVYYAEGKEVERIVGGVPEGPTTNGNTPDKFKEFFTKYKK